MKRLACIALFFLFGSGGLSAIAEAKPPSTVIFFADDLGYGDVGYQGGDLPTPSIDAIADQGVRFTDGYVTCPMCGPSRAGLLTGRYQQRFGFGDNPGPYRRADAAEAGIPTSEPILSERIAGLGYKTGFFGKSHDGEAEAQMPFSRWHEFYGFNNGASNYLADLNRPHNPIFHNRDAISQPRLRRSSRPDELLQNGVIASDAGDYLTDAIGDAAVAFIDTYHKQPFLCYVPFNAIHGPFQAPKKIFGQYPDETNHDRRLVKAMLASLDENVGKVLQALARHNLDANTLVVFLSDNGGHEHSPNTPLRGKKGTLWEGGIRVPFCMRWPGTIAPGSVYRDPVSSLDILPTVLAAAGGSINPDWKLDGVDLLPFLNGTAEQPPHESLFWSWGPRSAIRQGDFKLLSNDAGSGFSLYNLRHDIGETQDLFQSMPDRAAAMKKQLTAWAAELPPNAAGWSRDIGPKDPAFGKTRPYHRGNSPHSTAKSPPEADISTIEVSYAAEQDLPELIAAYVDPAPQARNDGLAVGELGKDGGDKAAVLRFAEEIAAGDHGEIDSLLLWANGKLVFESYFRRGRINYPHFQMSITKSYTALAIGRAIQLGHLTMADLNRPVVSFLQGLHSENFAAGASTITLSEAMTMQSGIRIPPKKLQFLKESPPAVQGVKQVQAFLENTASIAAAPREFKYQGTDTAITMQVLEAVVPGSAREFIKRELLDKMGITNFGWQEDISGLPKAAAGSSMRSRDMLKWGLLVHNKGRHKGEQLIPPTFIDRATSRLCNTAGETYYGFFFWRHTATVDGRPVDCITCRGAGGQFIFFFPGHDFIAVATAHNTGMGPLLKTLPERVLPAFTD